MDLFSDRLPMKQRSQKIDNNCEYEGIKSLFYQKANIIFENKLKSMITLSGEGTSWVLETAIDGDENIEDRLFKMWLLIIGSKDN